MGIGVQHFAGSIGVYSLNAVEEWLRIGWALIVQPQTRHNTIGRQAVRQLFKNLYGHLTGFNRVLRFPQCLGLQHQ